jgi:hypothetical protein
MRRSGIFSAWCLVLTVISTGCQSDPSNTEKGALFGGLFGAGLGALAAGPHHAAAGALIGGAAGAATGAAIGNCEDRQQAARNRSASTAVAVSDVIAMVQSHVSDDQIIKDIKLYGVLARPTSNDLILLKQNKVSDRVIDAMRSAPIVTARTVVYGSAPPPVVIYEAGPPPPRCYEPPPPW